MDRLTITEVARRTGMDRGVLARFLAVPANRDIFGAYGKPPSYPEESMVLFHRLFALYQAGSVKPQTLAGSSVLLFTEDGAPAADLRGNRLSGKNTLVPSTQVPPTQFTRADLQSLITSAVVDALQQTAAAHPSPLPPDAPLTRQQAAAVLGCHPNNVSRHVTPVMRGVYSSLMVQAVFARWRSAAEEKQREKVSHNERRDGM